MTNMIRIQPTKDRLRPFAVWATAQTPKVRTVGISTFAVPAHLFVEAPESILIGALIEGRRYVSPEEDAAQGRPEPGPATGGLVDPSGGSLALVGESVPETVIPATRPDRSRQLTEQSGLGELLTDQPGLVERLGAAVTESLTPEAPDSDRSDSKPNKTAGVGGGKPVCDICQREFTSTRGRDAHRRQVHPEA
ncbi:hypothetical protein ACWCQE_26715 [Streptomyces sp. NPDC002409]